jgi:hypothetical protein
MPGIEPGRQRLQGAPATSAPHPQVPGGWRLAAMLTLWSCQLTCTFAPQDGAPHGRKDSNPDQASWNRPYVFSYANRPSGGFPCGRLPGVCFCFYPEASVPVPYSADGRMAARRS